MSTLTRAEVAGLRDKLQYVKGICVGLEKYVLIDKDGEKLMDVWNYYDNVRLKTLDLVLDRMVGDDSAAWVIAEIERLHHQRIVSEDKDEQYRLETDAYALRQVAELLGSDEYEAQDAATRGIKAGFEVRLERINAEKGNNAEVVLVREDA